MAAAELGDHVKAVVARGGRPDMAAHVQGTGLALEGLTDEWDETDGNTIMIKSAHGTTALLSFRAAVLPETVDALVA